MNKVEIKIDNLADGSVEILLQGHLDEMHKYSPLASVHALDSTALRDASITFWGAWIDNELAACGALKEMSSDHAEIKSMKTSKLHLRKGLANKILNNILEEAKVRNYASVYLETGTHAVFFPAKKLYQNFGFQECEPFGDYTFDPYSTFYKKELS